MKIFNLNQKMLIQNGLTLIGTDIPTKIIIYEKKFFKEYW